MASDGEPRLLGTLVIVILRAKNLPDRSKLGKQDPYCAFKLRDQLKRTKKVKKGGQHPEFDDEVRFQIFEDTEDVIARKKQSATPSLPGGDAGSAVGGPLTSASRDSLPSLKPSKKGVIMQLFADDPKEPKMVGECVIDLSPVMKLGEHDDWYTLMYKERYAGEVSLELTYFINSAPPMPPKVAKPVKRPLSHHSSLASSASVSTMPLPPRRPLSMANLGSQGQQAFGSLPYRPRPYNTDAVQLPSDFGAYSGVSAGSFAGHSVYDGQNQAYQLEYPQQPSHQQYLEAAGAPWTPPPPAHAPSAADNLADSFGNLSVARNQMQATAYPGPQHGSIPANQHFSQHYSDPNVAHSSWSAGPPPSGDPYALPGTNFGSGTQNYQQQQQTHQHTAYPIYPPPSLLPDSAGTSHLYNQSQEPTPPRPYSSAVPPTSSFPHLAAPWPAPLPPDPYGQPSPLPAQPPAHLEGPPQDLYGTMPTEHYYPPPPSMLTADPNASAPFIDNRPPLPTTAPAYPTPPPPLPPPPPPRPYSTGHYGVPTSSFPQLQQDLSGFGTAADPRQLPFSGAGDPAAQQQPQRNSFSGYNAPEAPSLPTFATRSRSGRRYLESLGSSKVLAEPPVSNQYNPGTSYNTGMNGRAPSPQPYLGIHMGYAPTGPPPPLSPRPGSWIGPPAPLPVSLQDYHQ